MRNGLRRLVLRLAIAIAGAALVTTGLMQLGAQRDGLEIREAVVDGMPVRFVFAMNRAERSAPGVLVAHGFAASHRLMLGYAYALAHDGYAVTPWDFAGHGANTDRPGEGGRRLHGEVDSALAFLLDQPEVDQHQLAIVGHSMGSGAAMTAGIRYPGIYGAVVAISPTGAAVNEDLPRNLLLQAGPWEPR